MKKTLFCRLQANSYFKRNYFGNSFLNVNNNYNLKFNGQGIILSTLSCILIPNNKNYNYNMKSLSGQRI